MALSLSHFFRPRIFFGRDMNKSAARTSDSTPTQDQVGMPPSRTLVALDAETFAQNAWDLNWLSHLPRATILLFYRQELRLDLRLAVPARAQLHPLPSYESNLPAHMARAVVFEARRGYRYVVLLAPQHEALQAAVRFLRGQGFTTELIEEPAQALPFALEASSAAGDYPHPRKADVPRVRIDPRTGKRRRRRRVKLPTSSENLVLVMRALLKNFRLGEVYSKTQISPIIHKETHRNVKDLFPYKNLTGLYRYLLANDLIEQVDTKTFRVISTDWQPPESPSSPQQLEEAA